MDVVHDLLIYYYVTRGTKTRNFLGSNFLLAKPYRTKPAKPFLTTSLKSEYDCLSWHCHFATKMTPDTLKMIDMIKSQRGVKGNSHLDNIQTEVSAGGVKRDVDSTLKCTHLNSIYHRGRLVAMLIHNSLPLQGVPKKRTFRMLLDPEWTGSITPCVWKSIFWSFLTKTQQDQALPSHVHSKV